MTEKNFFKSAPLVASRRGHWDRRIAEMKMPGGRCVLGITLSKQCLYMNLYMHSQLFSSPWFLRIQKVLFYLKKTAQLLWIDEKMTKWICWFFIENVEIMKKCGKEMIKGALRLYINDFIRLSHLSISADLHNLLVLPPKMYRWLSQKRPKYISIIRVSLAISLILGVSIRIRATEDGSSASGWPLTITILFLLELMAQLGFYLRIVWRVK